MSGLWKKRAVYPIDKNNLIGVDVMQKEFLNFFELNAIVLFWKKIE